MTIKPDPAESHRRLYSAAARMLWAQVDPVWRGDTWPPERARVWRDLEECLTTVATGSGPRSGPVDPAHHLLSLRTGEGGPFAVGDAVHAWEARLDSDPGPDVPDEDGPLVRALVVDAAWQSTVLDLLAELGQRLAPGRPGHTVGEEAAELAGMVRETAEALRRPLVSGVATDTVSTTFPASTGAGASPEPPTEVTEADRTRLRETVGAALRTVPSRAEVERGDFSIRIAVCDAAADLARIHGGGDAPEWRESHPGVTPERHLVHGYHWGPGPARPLSFAERADGLRAVHTGYAAPRLLLPNDPPAELVGADGGRAVLSAETALVAADLLGELAARLTPGTHVGTVHFTAYPVHLFLRGRFQRALTAG
ncbi:hypothetical protein [Nocardiopsis dassonvillei]|uniref:hypothetical protein n=1 Tax=Nocardiopsis dassonvillei TaxID=2014 RepID=UPI0008FCD91D|nr:hypothetical protein [Nocardiopsis dassonvillei]APC33487.1 hypothetical protein A9R04_01650 [Nocardiopsis dassonvillei]